MMRKILRVPVRAGNFISHVCTFINILEENGVFGIKSKFQPRAAAVAEIERSGFDDRNVVKEVYTALTFQGKAYLRAGIQEWTKFRERERQMQAKGHLQPALVKIIGDVVYTRYFSRIRSCLSHV